MSVEQATICAIELSAAQQYVAPFGGDLMIKAVMAPDVPDARTIIPTTSRKVTTKGTVDKQWVTDTDYDSEEVLDNTRD